MSNIGFQRWIALVIPGIVLALSLLMQFDLMLSSKNLGELVLSSGKYSTVAGIVLFFIGLILGLLVDAVHHIVEYVILVVLRLIKDCATKDLSFIATVKNVLTMERGKGHVMADKTESPLYNLAMIGIEELRYMEEEFYYSEFFFNMVLPLIVLGFVFPEYIKTWSILCGLDPFIESYGRVIIQCVAFFSLIAGIGILISYRQGMELLREGSLARSSDVLTLKEAALFLRMNDSVLLELAQAGQVPRKLITGEFLFLRSELKRWIQGGTNLIYR